MNQILLGVSTRGYESSLDRPVSQVKSRGTSKSAASRHLVAATRKKLDDYLSRCLEDVELLALMVDGLEIAGHTVVVSLGITADGTKVPLGLRVGSTENTVLCTSLLQDLLERGLRIDRRVLCVVDGGKGIIRALRDVLGDLAVVQRCQVHKLRNLRSHLPKSRHAYVLRMMKDAYKSEKVDHARKLLRRLVAWLERNGYDDAAGSLREGLEETLTVIKAWPPRFSPELARYHERHREPEWKHPSCVSQRQEMEEPGDDPTLVGPGRRHGSEEVQKDQRLSVYERSSSRSSTPTMLSPNSIDFWIV